MLESLVASLRSLFRRHHGAEPLVAVAPGRVNIIGEHTDYNDGFVMPMAIDRYVGAAFRRRTDSVVSVHAQAFEESRTFDLGELPESSGADSLSDAVRAHIFTRRTDGWSDYVEGVAWSLLAEAERSAENLPGADVLIDGDVPVGAGLSSSAALEVAFAWALADLWELDLDVRKIAHLARRAENLYVGVSCGIMDQFAAAAGRSDRAIVLDCRSLETEYVPLPEEAAVLVLDTGVRRSLGDGTYNERVRQCEEAVQALRETGLEIDSLRDLSPEMLDRHEDRLDPVPLRRARHVVEENGRVHAFAGALRSEDLERAGELLDESHASLADLYEVSSPELNAMTQAAREHPSCVGARLTGAGLGGCALALLRASAQETVEEVAEESLAHYGSRFHHEARAYSVRATAGAQVLDIGETPSRE